MEKVHSLQRGGPIFQKLVPSVPPPDGTVEIPINSKFGEDLPLAEHWQWTVPRLDISEVTKAEYGIPFYYPAVGKKCKVYFHCALMNTYLVKGLNGFWIFDEGLAWGGFIYENWKETFEMLSFSNLWVTIPLKTPT